MNAGGVLSSRRLLIWGKTLLVRGTTLASFALATVNANSSALSEIHDGDLQRALEESIALHRVVGASAAVYIDGQIQSAAAGIANVDTGYQVTPETLMHIGSTAKLITSTLVLQLVDEGLIDLEAPITRYLSNSDIHFPPEFKDITVAMLISHSNGINGDMFPQRERDKEVIHNTVRRLSEQPLLFPPGTQGSYSNGGMVLAGYLTSQVLQESWYSAVESRVFNKAGMNHSLVTPEEGISYRTSVGHLLKPHSNEIYRSPSAFTQISFSPAGSTAMASAEDLITFAQIHLNNGIAPNGNRILTEKSVELMRQPRSRYPGFSAKGSWGLGWEITDGGLLQHGGGGSGVNALLIMHPPSKFAAAVITNTQTGRRVIADILNPYIEALAPDDLNSPKPPEPSGSESDISQYIGRYEDVTARFDIGINEGHLTGSLALKIQAYDNFSTKPTERIPLQRIGEDVYTLELPPGSASLPQGGVIPLHFIRPTKGSAVSHVATRNHLYRRTSIGDLKP